METYKVLSRMYTVNVFWLGSRLNKILMFVQDSMYEHETVVSCANMISAKNAYVI